MNLNAAWHALSTDTRLWVALALVGVDFVLGVLASFHRGDFSLSRIAKFAETDFAFKLLPWASLFVAAQFAGGALDTVEKVVYAAIVAAWTGSILSSLAELGIAPGAAKLTGPETPPPAPAAVPPPK